MDEKLPDNSSIVKATSLIEYNNSIVGYTIPYINGSSLSDTCYSKKDKIKILKDISSKLKTFKADCVHHNKILF